MAKVGIFGLGEAGGLFAADLVAAGVEVSGFDPARVATPDGVRRCGEPGEAVLEADFVFGVTASVDATGAMAQALDDIPSSAVYADFSTSAAGLKKELAGMAAERGIVFADIALLAIVPGNGIRATALASGTGAERFVAFMRPLGMPVAAIGADAGAAATRKLLRSVMMKGLAAVAIEAMRAGEAAGCAEWLWSNLAAQVTEADEKTLRRLVQGTGQHHLRRLHEMEASTALLEELGVEPVMTRCTAESLRRVPHDGVPDLPDRSND